VALDQIVRARSRSGQALAARITTSSPAARPASRSTRTGIVTCRLLETLLFGDHRIPMNVVRIRPEADIREAAESAFDQHRSRILRLLPHAQIEHVGATSIPGALTKGDLDVLVRVGSHDFDAAVQRLRGLYAIHQPANWTATLASFVDREAADPPVGVQLVVAGSPDDRMFGTFRDAMIRAPQLLVEYNALKLRHDGDDYERYTDAKGRFVCEVLARAGSRGL